MKCSHCGKASKGMLKGVQIAWWKYGSRQSSRYCKQHFDATLIQVGSWTLLNCLRSKLCTTDNYRALQTLKFWMRDFGHNSICTCQHVKTCEQQKTCMEWSDVCTSTAFSVRWRFSMTSQCKRAIKNKRSTISLWLRMQLSGVSTWRSTWQRQAEDSGRVSKLSGTRISQDGPCSAVSWVGTCAAGQKLFGGAKTAPWPLGFQSLCWMCWNHRWTFFVRWGVRFEAARPTHCGHWRCVCVSLSSLGFMRIDPHCRMNKLGIRHMKNLQELNRRNQELIAAAKMRFTVPRLALRNPLCDANSLCSKHCRAC